ncbi:MAG: hypothetical protein WCP87_02800, partial [Atribacterota bacterium]
GLDYAGMKGRAVFRSGFFGLPHDAGIGCRNSRERGDAAFLEDREPGGCRKCWKDFWENPGKNFR